MDVGTVVGRWGSESIFSQAVKSDSKILQARTIFANGAEDKAQNQPSSGGTTDTCNLAAHSVGEM